MDKGLSGKRQRKAVRGDLRSPKRPGLSDRDLAVMQLIAQQDGGPVTTAQISVLHWPRDVARMLSVWGLDTQTVSGVLGQYPASYVGHRLEQAKFVFKLAKTAPEQLEALPPLWQQALIMKPQEWLLQVIASDVAAPDVFTDRICHPSEFVSSAAKERLRALVDADLLTVDELPVRRRSGSGQYLYYLTAKGKQRLATESGIENKEIAYRRPGQLSDFKLLHHLQCVDLAVSIRLSCQRLGYRMLQEYTDGQLKKMMESYKVTYRLRRNPTDSGSVEEFEGLTIPDYFFAVEANGKVFAHLVEVDRGFSPVRSHKPGLRDFRRRVAILSEVYKSRLYHQLFPVAGNSFRYLVITNRSVDARGVHNRVESLKKTAEEALREVSESDRDVRQARQRYWFAHWSAVKPSVTDYFSASTILDGSWWLQAGDEQHRALIW